MRKRRRQLRLMMMFLVILFLIGGLLKILRTGKGGSMLKQQTESPLNMENGNSEAVQDWQNVRIRVILLSTGYQDMMHPEVSLASDTGLRICYGEAVEEWKASEPFVIRPDDVRFSSGIVRVEPLTADSEIQVGNIERGYGTPSYAGILELRVTAEGIVLINELPVEEYLCKVVPSEMPASYELEALKAQAVCARSYAYRQLEKYGYPEYEAHVNDSTDYQVYNNSPAQEKSSQAVWETCGQAAWYGGSIAITYYYSTSCGRTTDLSAWGGEVNESNAYLRSVEVSNGDEDYEKNLPWYRWSARIPAETLSNLVGLNTGVDVGSLQSVEVTRRGAGDIALQIVASGDKGSITVDTENKIRTALGGTGYFITKNDGTTVESTRLLPSAFFTIERQGQEFIITGGGFGHGIGMSQNGANEMAKQGKDYREILSLFYSGIEIK